MRQPATDATTRSRLRTSRRGGTTERVHPLPAASCRSRRSRCSPDLAAPRIGQAQIECSVPQGSFKGAPPPLSLRRSPRHNKRVAVEVKRRTVKPPPTGGRETGAPSGESARGSRRGESEMTSKRHVQKQRNRIAAFVAAATVSSAVLATSPLTTQSAFGATGSGVITTIAGTGTAGYGGDGGLGSLAKLSSPTMVVQAPDGRVLIADQANNVVRGLKPDATIRTYAGVAGAGSFGGDG